MLLFIFNSSSSLVFCFHLSIILLLYISLFFAFLLSFPVIILWSSIIICPYVVFPIFFHSDMKISGCFVLSRIFCWCIKICFSLLLFSSFFNIIIFFPYIFPHSTSFFFSTYFYIYFYYFLLQIFISYILCFVLSSSSVK